MKIQSNIRAFFSQNVLLFLVLFVLAVRIYPLIRGGITNIETLNTMLVIKQFALGDSNIIFTESWLQVYFVTIPYALLGGILDVLQVMHIVKALLVVFSTFVVYLLAKELTGNKTAGYFALLLFAVSPLATYSQGLGVWSGDVIAPVFLAASLLFMLYAKAHWKRSSFYLWGALSVFSVIIAYASWTGGIYAVVTYVFVLVFLLLQHTLRNLRRTFFIGIIFIILAFLIYIPSKANAGILIGGNYMGGITDTVIQFISNNDYSLYGSGAVNYPVNFTVTPLYTFTLPAGFLTSTFLILFLTYFYLNGKNKTHEGTAFIAVMVLYLIATPIALSYRRFDSLDILPIAILAGGGLDILLQNVDKKPKLSLYAKAAFAIIISYVLLGSLFQVVGARYTDELAPQYLSTMQWISLNTPENATFLTDIFNEAPIEYFGNRQGAQDGWNGGIWVINETQNVQFDNFLFSPSCNSTYLNYTHANYLLVNSFWLYPSYIKNATVNGTNMKTLINGNFYINCSGLHLVLVYESVDNVTKVYEIERSTPNSSTELGELLGVYQANHILMNNLTLVSGPDVSNLSISGEDYLVYEEFATKNRSRKLAVSYISFANESDAALGYLQSLLTLRNSTGIAHADIGKIFNTTYIYYNTTNGGESLAEATYGNDLLSFISVNMSFSPYQAKLLLYNQILNLNNACNITRNSSNSISLRC